MCVGLFPFDGAFVLLVEFMLVCACIVLLWFVVFVLAGMVCDVVVCVVVLCLLYWFVVV